MAIAPIYGFPASALPLPPGLTDNEQILSVANPPTSAPGATTYYVSRRMKFDGGVYQIKALVDDAATWWIGTSLTSTRMVFSNTLTQGVVTGDFYVAPGTQRVDIILQNLSPGASPCFAIFSLWRDGRLVYASAPDGWVFDTAPIPDEDLPQIEDARLSMPVWSILPNWKNGITERLSWQTDLMESETGVEQRRAVRVHPRRSIEASFLRQGAQRSRMDVFFAGVGQYELLVPLWHEQVKMTQGITIGATGVAFGSASTQYREFRTGDLVFVNAGDPDDYELLMVAEVEPARFGWATLPTRAWPPGTRVFPCRVARIIDPPQLANRSDRVGIAQVRFELTMPDVWAPSWGDYIGDVPMFQFRPDRKQDIQLDYTRKSFLLDNSAGVIQVTDWSGEPKIGMKMGFTFFGRDRVTAFRRMLAAARGRAVEFYTPTFTHDIVPRADIDGSTPYLEAQPMGYTETMTRPQPTRLIIMVEPADGSAPIYRNIVNVEPVFERVLRDYVFRYTSLHGGGEYVPITGQGNGIYRLSGGNRLYELVSGFNLTAFDGSTGLPVWHDTFEITALDPVQVEQARDALIATLNALTPDLVIVLHTARHFNGGANPWEEIFTPELIAAIQRCGGTAATLANFKTCAGYMLLGVPGIGTGRGIERYAGEIDYDPAATIEYVFRLHNGRPIAIEGVPDEKLIGERFTLDDPLPAMTRAEIGRISFTTPARLDQDSVELHHVTSGSRAVETSLVLRQFLNRRQGGLI